MTDAQLIQLWNLLFPDNDSREISEQDLRDGLIAFLNTMSTRIGSLPNLSTFIKTSLVAAINELVSRLENLEDRFAPQFGIADPNEVPPPNYYDYGSIYLQQQNIGGNIYDIGFWIYTNVQNVGWLNLISLIKPVYEGTDNPNTTPPAGFNNNNGTKGALYYQRIFATQGVVDRGFWIYVSPTTKWINLMAKEIEWVANLPTTGLVNILYIRTSDNTMHRYYASGTILDPPGWRQLGGSSGLNYVQVDYADNDDIEIPAGTNDVPYIIIDSTPFQKGTGAFVLDLPNNLLKLTPGYAATGQKIMIFRT